MYTQIWNRYLPVIRILLKRSVTGEQTLNLNIADFERAGLARKAGNKFNIHFSNGRADNVTNTSPLTKDFAATLLADAMIKDLFTKNDYIITMNTKYQLGIQFISNNVVEEPVEAGQEAVVE
ncbi:MAG TPA: hypothetical protein VM888_00700 [Chitinophagaceae bacterium]|jgi:hypothetical protein|nr:hypothetical protein [Chitinophagaceae bacterium]